MNAFWAQVRVIAYRDFKAVVGTPVFLIFLLAPLMMMVMGALGGGGAHLAAERSARTARVVLLANEDVARQMRAADARLRPIAGGDLIVPRLEVIPSHGAADMDIARAMIGQQGSRYEAVLLGPPSAPVIHAKNQETASYLAALADQIARNERAGISAKDQVSKAKIVIARHAGSSARLRMGAGYAATFILFLLSLMLSAQAVGTFAEEKSNKIIEILAASAPLEAVFVGKLVGLYGVALLFIGFWGTLGAAGVEALQSLPGFPTGSFSVAIGMPAFLALWLVYFSLAFFLFGAVFLGVGAQAPTVRDIQMLSLPITLFQFGMFGLASSAASQPDSRIARIAEIFPFSSPFAMAARGATDAGLWPHLLAICWQLVWLVLVIRWSAALFRRGVLNNGPGFWTRFGRRRSSHGPSQSAVSPPNPH